MTHFTISHYFFTLAFLAAGLLWGISIWNGTIKAILLAVWYQKFENGAALQTNYTGLIIFDFPLSILVAFFFSSTNNSDRGQQLFTIDAFATLLPAYVWLYVESARKIKKSPSIENPIIWVVLWQIFGAAILLPLYFSRHLQWLSEQPDALAGSRIASSKALPISFISGAVLPTVIATMWPSWGLFDSLGHQKILAVWQLTPVWVSFIQIVLVWIKSAQAQASDDENAAWWSQLSYLLAAVISFAGHAYALAAIALSLDPSLNLQRTHLPTFFTGLQGSPDILTRGPWLFLQSDAMIISLSSVSWAYVLVSRLAASRSAKSGGKMLADLLLLLAGFVIGGATIGPGAIVCVALWWREGKYNQTGHGNILAKMLNV
ncbi:hypothetical protein B0O99DRAFT_650379 [Bisporella sp. PMI_857]|nr:hypothetical protein B0O99DRAFT_650379 [Bisporella sp. PMI_857]